MNNTKRKLLKNSKVIGTFVTLNSLEVVQILSNVGYDYLVIDYEHGAMGLETLGQQVLVAKGTNTTPIVRVPYNNVENIKKVLDAGAYGIMVPMIKTVDDVKKFIEYSNFPPIGIRGCGATRANNFYTKAEEYFEFEKTEILRIIQIETKEAVENIDEILSVDGVDVAFIGPYDLSYALGVPGDVQGPVVSKAIKEISEAGKRNNVKLGIMSNNNQLESHMDLGFDFILLGLDGALLYSAAANDISNFESKQK